MAAQCELRAKDAGIAPARKPTSVRPVTEADFDGWLALWIAYQQFYQVTISDESTRVAWARFQDPVEPMFCAVSVDERDEAVGLVHWVLHRSSWTAGAYCYLQDLFVEPQMRGLGRGRALIKHVYHEAEVNHCSRVYWLTHEDNKAAMLLYDRVAVRTGFVQYCHLLTTKR